jgi:hypothetical protein
LSGFMNNVGALALLHAGGPDHGAAALFPPGLLLMRCRSPRCSAA